MRKLNPKSKATQAEVGESCAHDRTLSPKFKSEAKTAKVSKSRGQHCTRSRQSAVCAQAEVKGQGTLSVQAQAKWQAQGKAQSAKPVSPAVQAAMPVIRTVRGAVGQRGAQAKSFSLSGLSVPEATGQAQDEAPSAKPVKSFKSAETESKSGEVRSKSAKIKFKWWRSMRHQSGKH